MAICVHRSSVIQPVRILSALLGTALVIGNPQAASAATLATVCQSALAQDPEFGAAAQAAREADERLTVARTGFYPRLNVDGELASSQFTRASGTVPLFTRAAEVGATEMIYDGGATWHRAAGTEHERNAVHADRATTANKVALNVVNAYLGVARNRELLACAQRYVADHTSAVAKLEAMVRSDRGKGFDLQQVRARAVFAESQLAERLAELRVSEGRFQELTGARATELDFPTPLAGKGMDALRDALALATETHPAVVAMTLRHKARLAARQQADAALSPIFSADARYRMGVDRSGLPGRNDEGYLGVRATYALSSGGSQFTAVRSARAEAERAESRVEAARRDVREAVRVAWDRRAGLLATLPLAETSFQTSRTVLEGFRSQYLTGQRSALDLLRVQADVYGAETRVIGMRYDRLRADYELAHSQGRLAAWLPLTPPTATTQVSR